MKIPSGALRFVPALLIGIGLLIFTSGCSQTPTEVPAGASVIDVRSPGEYASGHLDGAQNIDLNSGSFPAQIEQLDPKQPYALYCRSGNRSSQAAQIMRDAGFSEVYDLGSMSNAGSVLGLEVVK